MLWWFIGMGCTTDSTLLIDARGGGGGYWPRHSTTAVIGAIDSQFPSFEVDVTPTADGDWLLHGGSQWVNCIDVRTKLPPDPSNILEWQRSEAISVVRCGGLPDSQQPNAQVVAEPPLDLRGLAQTIRTGGAFDQRVHLHLRIPEQLDDGVTRVADALRTWADADLPNPLHISVDQRAWLQVVEGERRRANLEATTTLRWLDEESFDSDIELARELWEEVAELGATGVALPEDAWTATYLRRAEDAGLHTVALSANDPATWRSSFSAVLTDYPADVP